MEGREGDELNRRKFKKKKKQKIYQKSGKEGEEKTETNDDSITNSLIEHRLSLKEAVGSSTNSVDHRVVLCWKIVRWT